MRLSSSTTRSFRVKRIGIIVSSPWTIKWFLMDQIEALSRSYEVCVILNIEKGDALPELNAKVEVITAPIVRNMSVLRDLHAVLRLVALFLRKRFDAVHSVTPKAGLIAGMSGAIARIPVRIHTFTGQVWITRTGIARFVLKTADKAIARMTTHVLVDSPSQRDFLLREGVVSEKKSRVLASGSISGVDTIRFRPDSELRQKIRQLEGIPENGVVFLYVGRLKVDKGVLDLAQAFARVGEYCGKAWLLIVGPDEEGLRPRIESLCYAVGRRLRFVGYTDGPEEYMAASDVLCLPSYREGFGSVIIEAASVGIPAVASNIYGIIDAIEPSAVEFLHEPGDIDALQSKMKQMIDDPQLREVLGEKARARAHRLFAKGLVTSTLVGFYDSVVGSGAELAGPLPRIRNGPPLGPFSKQ
jgi:glycosyltransferase involved in cell wall biosynthesis